MSTSILVEWRPHSPFLVRVERLAAIESRRWGGEPSEALGHLWEGLRKVFPEGSSVEADDGLLKLVIRRRVHNFFLRQRDRCVSLSAIEEPSHRRTSAPDEGALYRELYEAYTGALSALNPRRREAARAAVGFDDARTIGEVARSWGSTTQNVRQLAGKAKGEIRASLARFAP